MKYIECSATVMLLWWSCNACVLQSLCDKHANNGIELLKIYNMVERGSDGLVITKLVKLFIIMRNIDDLLYIYHLMVHYILSVCENKCL